MKKLKLVFGLLLLTIAIFGQTAQDAKDYISEKVGGSNPLPNYGNHVFFSDNILLSDAENLAGRKLSADEFKYLFIYMRDIFTDGSKRKWAFAVAESVDIRGITKVSTTRNTGDTRDDNYCTITVYLDGNRLAKQYGHSSVDNQKKYESISKMEILISDDYNIATNIKLAIIKMGDIYGILIKDGDKF